MASGWGREWLRPKGLLSAVGGTSDPALKPNIPSRCRACSSDECRQRLRPPRRPSAAMGGTNQRDSSLRRGGVQGATRLRGCGPADYAGPGGPARRWTKRINNTANPRAPEEPDFRTRTCRALIAAGLRVGQSCSPTYTIGLDSNTAIPGMSLRIAGECVARPLRPGNHAGGNGAADHSAAVGAAPRAGRGASFRAQSGPRRLPWPREPKDRGGPAAHCAGWLEAALRPVDDSSTSLTRRRPWADGIALGTARRAARPSGTKTMPALPVPDTGKDGARTAPAMEGGRKESVVAPLSAPGPTTRPASERRGGGGAIMQYTCPREHGRRAYRLWTETGKIFHNGGDPPFPTPSQMAAGAGAAPCPLMFDADGHARAAGP